MLGDASMASLAESFNKRSQAVVTPRILMKDLQLKKRYKVKLFKEVEVPKTGRAVIAVIEVPERGRELHDCFLPRRFTDVLTQEEIFKYNEEPNLFLRYRGIGDNREFIVKLEQ